MSTRDARREVAGRAPGACIAYSTWDMGCVGSGMALALWDRHRLLYIACSRRVGAASSEAAASGGWRLGLGPGATPQLGLGLGKAFGFWEKI